MRLKKSTKFFIDDSDLESKMLEYALKKVIDSMSKNMQMTMKARKQAELAYQKAEIHAKAMRKAKFGKLEIPIDENSKYLAGVISVIFMLMLGVQTAIKATDGARRLAGEVRRWQEKKDKVRLTQAEKRKQEQFAFEREQSEYREHRSPGRPRTRPVSNEPKRKPGRPKKV